MVNQGFFSTEKKRMAGEKENTPFFSTKVESVKVANNINSYQDQTPSIKYPGDDYKDAYREEKKESYKDTSYGSDMETAIQNLDRFSKRGLGLDNIKEHGVPMSKEELKSKKAYEISNDSYYGRGLKNVNYDNIKADYDKYQPERDRREFRSEVTDNLDAWRRDYMRKFNEADYQIKMKRYNMDNTENEMNKYVLSKDERMERQEQAGSMGPNIVTDRYGNIMDRKDRDEMNKKYDAEEEKRTKFYSEKYKKAYEDSQKNVFQKIGDTVGDITGKVFNTLTGTLPAKGDTLDTNRAQQALSAASSFRDSSPNLGITSRGTRRSISSGRAAQFSGDGKGLAKTFGGGFNLGISKGFGGGLNTSATRRRGAGAPTGRAATGQGDKGGQTGNQSTPTQSRINTSQSRRRGSSGSSSKKSGGSSGSGGSGGSGGSSSSGGTSKGSTTGRKASSASKSNTGRGRSQCDIRTKIDIAPLTNTDLIRDDLANVAYFVKEIK